jgi:transcriptional regulator GlxA family with amidase domain
VNRRTFLSATLATGAAFAASLRSAWVLRADDKVGAHEKGVVVSTTKLTSPERGTINVAIPISEGATVIDFAGPWDVFASVMLPERGSTMEDQMPFQLFMVSDKLAPVTVEGGMKLVPHHTFADAPPPKIVVVPAQRGSNELRDWLRKVAPTADVAMSVCVGVNQLAKAGLLTGKSVTTHHDYYDRFAKEYPDIELRRGVRFVENERISASGGESCGIDLALRVVERYFGRSVAERTAFYIEYQGKGWIA